MVPLTKNTPHQRHLPWFLVQKVVPKHCSLAPTGRFMSSPLQRAYTSWFSCAF